MAQEDNKAIARRVFEEWNTGKIDDVADQLVAPDAVWHDAQDPFQDIRGPEHLKRLAHMYRDAFSDLRFDIKLQIAEDDYVSTLLEGTGTNDGELTGLPPTGKRSNVMVTSTSKIVDGKMVESWTTWDTLGMLQQLGLAPKGAQAATA
jgi:predicted ester cyclase